MNKCRHFVTAPLRQSSGDSRPSQPERRAGYSSGERGQGHRGRQRLVTHPEKPRGLPRQQPLPRPCLLAEPERITAAERIDGGVEARGIRAQLIERVRLHGRGNSSRRSNATHMGSLRRAGQHLRNARRPVQHFFRVSRVPPVSHAGRSPDPLIMRADRKLAGRRLKKWRMSRLQVRDKSILMPDLDSLDPETIPGAGFSASAIVSPLPGSNLEAHAAGATMTTYEPLFIWRESPFIKFSLLWP